MGFRLTAMQISGKPRDAILRRLGMRSSGILQLDPVEGVSGRAQPDGAYLIVAMDDQGRHAEPDLLRDLSDDADLVVCQIHEGCMWSRVAGWRDGEETWVIEHASETDHLHLDVAGTPPPQAAAIRAACEARDAAEPPRQFGVDHIFDIAPSLFAALTGYRYDRVDPRGAFEALIPL